MDRAAHAVGGALKLAVVGAGWAGLAAAVQASAAGAQVTLLDMAAAPGGRARRGGTLPSGLAYDNGQHILIGAYTQTLALMQRVGADPTTLLARRPLILKNSLDQGLALPPGPPLPAFARGLLAARHWPLAHRLRFLAMAGGWMLRGFACPPQWSVQHLCRRLPRTLYADLVQPLCVAALNTPAHLASAAVFLRVLRDALFGTVGGSDLLLPRVDLHELLPGPAMRWLAERGVTLRWRQRATALQRDGSTWRLDGEAFDQVVLATTSVEAARLAEPHAPAWAAQAQALRFEPIVTVLAQASGAALAAPMVALAAEPAQFVFDLGALRGAPGLLAFVVSGAGPWVARGLDATAQAVQAQARAQLGLEVTPLQTLADKRATFVCAPALQRPAGAVAPGLWAAGDYVAGPYPATLEGAVRSGLAAANAALSAAAPAPQTAPPAARR